MRQSALFARRPEATRLHPPQVRLLTPNARAMKNFTTTESEPGSKHLRTRTAALASDVAASLVITDWDAASIAFIAMSKLICVPECLLCNAPR